MQKDQDDLSPEEHVIEEVRIPREMYFALCARAKELNVSRDVYFGYLLLRYIDEVTPREAPNGPQPTP